MNLKCEKVRNDKLYAVGYNETNHRYLLLIVVPEVVSAQEIPLGAKGRTNT